MSNIRSNLARLFVHQDSKRIHGSERINHNLKKDKIDQIDQLTFPLTD
jgi:hypothetical protein